MPIRGREFGSTKISPRLNGLFGNCIQTRRAIGSRRRANSLPSAPQYSHNQTLPTTLTPYSFLLPSPLFLSLPISLSPRPPFVPSVPKNSRSFVIIRGHPHPLPSQPNVALHTYSLLLPPCSLSLSPSASQGLARGRQRAGTLPRKFLATACNQHYRNRANMHSPLYLLGGRSVTWPLAEALVKAGLN